MSTRGTCREELCDIDVSTSIASNQGARIRFLIEVATLRPGHSRVVRFSGNWVERRISGIERVK